MREREREREIERERERAFITMWSDWIVSNGGDCLSLSTLDMNRDKLDFSKLNLGISLRFAPEL